MTRRDRWIVAMPPVLLAAVALACGCGQTSRTTREASRLTPADFERPPEGSPNESVVRAYLAAVRRPGGPGMTAMDAAASGETAGRDAASASLASNPTARPARLGGGPATSADNGGAPFVMDAMVGQVHRENIYAGQVFKAIGEEQLYRLGEQLSRPVFMRRARELIDSHLRQRVIDALILREAERDLDERQRLGLLSMMREEEEKILARYRGVRALAEEGLRREKGRTLAEELEARRQSLLVERYMHEKFRPKLHVGRREVERYYHDHRQRYHNGATATVRVMIAHTEARADAIDAALAAGEPFEQVVRRYSDYRAEQGGLVPPYALADNALRWEALNEWVRELEPGEHSPRTEIDLNGEPAYGWVMLEELDGGESRSLPEVYREIENHLVAQKLNRMQRRHMEELLSSGSYTPIPQMTDALVEIAMARYAGPVLTEPRPSGP